MNEESISNSSARVRRIWFEEGFLKIPKSFFREFDLITNIYLCALIEWHHYLLKERKIENSEEFFMTRKLIQLRVGLTENQQRAAIKKLKDIKILIVKKKGMPAINYYRINYEKIEIFIQESLEVIERNKHSLELENPLQTGEFNLNRQVNLTSTDRLNSPHINNKTIESKNIGNKVFSYEKTDTSCDVTSDSKLKLLSRKNKSPIEFFPTHSYRKDISKIIDYWNSSPSLTTHRLGTKTFERIIKIIGGVIDGKFLQAWPSHSVEDIIKAIDGFKTRLTNPDYSPTDKTSIKNINLTTFFWNPYSSYIQSMFLECLTNSPTLLKNTVAKEKELNPQLTVWLQQFYTDKILLGQSKVFNQVEINKFIKGSNLLVSSMTNLRKRANLLTGPMEFCEYTVDALLNQFPREQIQIGNISSEWTYAELLPRYLNKLGRID